MTQNPWFRLATTLIGITVTDAFLLYNYHKVMNCGISDQQKKKHDSVFFWNLGLTAD
jgi:hypothetical protein